MKNAKINIPLGIIEKTDSSPYWRPYQASVPFPKGLLINTEGLQLVTDEYVVPAQFTILSYWSEKHSIKWLLVDFICPPKKEINNLRLKNKKVDQLTKSKFTPLKINKGKKKTSINTGLFETDLCTDSDSLIPIVILNGSTIPFNGIKLIIIDAKGEKYVSSSKDLNCEIEETGPIKTDVRIEGQHFSTKNVSYMKFCLYITFYAEQPILRISHALINCEGESEGDKFHQLREISIILSSGKNLSYWVAGKNLKVKSKIRAKKDLKIHLSSPDDKEQIMSSIPLIFFGNKKSGTCFLLKHFKEQFPKEIQANDKSFKICLYKDEKKPLRYCSGMGKIHEFIIGFYGENIVKPDLEKLITSQENISRAHSGPNWIASTKAIRGTFTAGRKRGAYPRIEMSIKNAMLYRSKYYGLLNWGDEIAWNYHRRGQTVTTYKGKQETLPVWNNNEYDFPFLAFHQYIRTGESYYFEEGEAAVQHMLGVDYLHEHKGWKNWQWEKERSVNGVIPHQSEHAGCGWMPCHMWLGGILYYYLLTGNKEALQKAKAIAESIAWNIKTNLAKEVLDKENKTHLAREYGWPLIAFSEIYEVTADEKYLQCSKEYIGVIHRWSKHSATLDDTGFCVALCLVGIGRYYQHTKDKKAKKLFMKLIKAMFEHLYLEEGLMAYKRPGTDQDHIQVPSGGMLGLEALVYAYEFTGDLEYIHTGMRELAYILDTGKLFTTQKLGGNLEIYQGIPIVHTYKRPSSTQEICYLLRHVWRFFEVADELGLLKAKDY